MGIRLNRRDFLKASAVGAAVGVAAIDAACKPPETAGQVGSTSDAGAVDTRPGIGLVDFISPNRDFQISLPNNNGWKLFSTRSTPTRETYEYQSNYYPNGDYDAIIVKRERRNVALENYRDFTKNLLEDSFRPTLAKGKGLRVEPESTNIKGLGAWEFTLEFPPNIQELGNPHHFTYFVVLVRNNEAWTLEARPAIGVEAPKEGLTRMKKIIKEQFKFL